MAKPPYEEKTTGVKQRKTLGILWKRPLTYGGEETGEERAKITEVGLTKEKKWSAGKKTSVESRQWGPVDSPQGTREP